MVVVVQEWRGFINCVRKWRKGRDILRQQFSGLFGIISICFSLRAVWISFFFVSMLIIFTGEMIPFSVSLGPHSFLWWAQVCPFSLGNYQYKGELIAGTIWHWGVVAYTGLGRRKITGLM